MIISPGSATDFVSVSRCFMDVLSGATNCVCYSLDLHGPVILFLRGGQAILYSCNLCSSHLLKSIIENENGSVWVSIEYQILSWIYIYTPWNTRLRIGKSHFFLCVFFLIGSVFVWIFLGGWVGVGVLLALWKISMNAYNVALWDMHTVQEVTLCLRPVSPSLPAENHGHFLGGQTLEHWGVL